MLPGEADADVLEECVWDVLLFISNMLLVFFKCLRK